MKSSTLHRSNLTKERMELLREIKSQKRVSNDSAPGIYVRPTKEKELDVLWQSFKVNQKDEKSPAVYLVTGFIVGALAMFLMTAIISFAAHSVSDDGNFRIEKEKVKSPQVSEKVAATAVSNESINFLPPDTAKSSANVGSKTETYTIKSGDTLDSVAMRFYGKYDNAQISKIANANNLANPNKLSIGQKLIIPID